MAILDYVGGVDNRRISKCPLACPGSRGPDRANRVHCPNTPRQRLMATHQDTPSIGTPHPCGTSLPDGFAVREVAVRRVSVRPLKVVDLQRRSQGVPAGTGVYIPS